MPMTELLLGAGADPALNPAGLRYKDSPLAYARSILLVIDQVKNEQGRTDEYAVLDGLASTYRLATIPINTQEKNELRTACQLVLQHDFVKNAKPSAFKQLEL